MTGVMGYAGLAVAIFALISVIISVALDYWTYFSEVGIRAYFGLWNGCGEVKGIKLCGSLTGLLLIVGFAVYIVKIFNPDKDLNPYITLHAGFAFCIIAWLASWTAAGLFCVATMQDRD